MQYVSVWEIFYLLAMGNSANKFRKALQQGNEVNACQLYVQNPDIRERLDPNSSHKDSHLHNTPLHYVAKYGMKSLLRDFLARGGNPNKQNSLDQTALHMLMVTASGEMDIVDQRRLDCLHLLLKWRGRAAFDGVEERLNLDAVDQEKKTALHLAAQSGLALCVQCLVAQGATLFLEDKQGLTACDLAERNQRDAVAAFLEAKMVFNGHEEEIVLLEDDLLTHIRDDEYSGLCAQDLQEIKDQLIVETSDMLQIPLFTAEGLLRNHDWSREMLLESWMEDPLAACEKAGVKLPQDHSALGALRNKLNGTQAKSYESQTSKHCCDICDEEFVMAGDEMTQIPCGHAFCKMCWERYLSSKIKDGNTHNILCPGHDCNKLVPVEITEKLVSRDMAKRYLQFDIKAFVDTNPNLRWCPHPSCGRAVKLPEAVTSPQRRMASTNQKAKSVDCGLGHYFCWICLGEAHEPCTCEAWQEWNKTVEETNPNKVSQEAEERESVANAYWLISNSKKCPNCRSHIQKNEGCNHMTCTKCKHDFCWVCQEPWKIHSAETGGYFRCNRFEVVKAVEDGYEREQKKMEKEHDEVQRIERFMHYYTRCKNHENSFQLEARLLNAVKEKVEGLQRAAAELGNGADVDAKFVEDAIKELLKSRQILKGSYPYGYFLDNNRGERTVFEFMQDEVEQAAETLSGMVARPFLKTPRSKIINATRKLSRKRKEFLSAIERGLIPDDDDDYLTTGDYAYGARQSRSRQANSRTRAIHHHTDSEPHSSTSPDLHPLHSIMRNRRRNRMQEILGLEPERNAEMQDEDELLEWLRVLRLELREAQSNEALMGEERRQNLISKIRRRVEDVRRRTFPKSKGKSKKSGSNVAETLENPAGVSDEDSVKRNKHRARRHRVVLFTDDESSTTDDETSYAKKRSSSDAAVIVTDGSDSDTDNGAQNAACACLSTVPKKTVVAQFDYAAYSPNELALEAGDVLEVLDKRADGWWRGRCKGREGMFPASFIVELETDEPITADASPESILLEENNAGDIDDLLQQAMTLSLAEHQSSDLQQPSTMEAHPACDSNGGYENIDIIPQPPHEE